MSRRSMHGHMDHEALSTSQRRRLERERETYAHMSASIGWVPQSAPPSEAVVAAQKAKERADEIEWLRQKIADARHFGTSRKTGRVRPTFLREIEALESALAALEAKP